MNRYFLILLFFSLLFIPVKTMAQEEPKSVQKRKAQLERQEEEKQRLGEKAHEEGVQQHMQIQTKETRKRMKKNKRKSKRHNDNKKEFFIKRWFSFIPKEEKIIFAETMLCCKLLG